MQVSNVEKLLNKMNISFKDLKQIDNPKSSFNSFVFSIDYIKRDVIYQKDLWPSGLVINRYFYKKTSTIPSNNESSTNASGSTNGSTSVSQTNNTVSIDTSVKTNNNSKTNSQ